jgi:hypothetical protein
VDESLTIAERFCGPPATANGGYLAGRLADLIAGTVEVTLRRATPLGRPLRLERVEGGIDVYDGDVRVAEARSVPALDLVPPQAVSPGEAAAASRAFPRFVDHPVPRCFVCGIDRASGDGLRIFPGPVPGREHIYAAPWTPDPSLCDESGFVRREFLWAALDSTGAFAVNEPPRGLALLGRISAEVRRAVRGGETVVVAAWPLASRGRKLEPATALYSTAGDLCAIARATWILT